MDLNSIKPVPSRKSTGWDYPTRESEKEKQTKHEHFKPRSVTQIRVRKGQQGTDLIDLWQLLEGVIFGMDPFGSL